jgi:F-type H+-transporting ATPase subunit delta
MNLQDAALAGRYAKALFQAARDAKAVDAVAEDLKTLAKGLRLDPGLKAALSHPRLSPAEKRAAVDKAAGKGGLHALTRRFTDLLLSKKRVSLLFMTAALFEDQSDRAAGLARVQARSAQPLTPEQSRALSASLEKALGAKVSLEGTVDPSLLGGVVLRAGDRVWDLSYTGRLRRLKEKLLETTH